MLFRSKPRRAQPTMKFIDDYCEAYRDLFPEVRTFEYFKYLHLGLISDIKRKTLPAIAKVVGLENAEGLDHFMSRDNFISAKCLNYNKNR